MIFGTWHFGRRHFGTDISSKGLFSTCSFCHKNILAPWMWNRDMMALGYFGTRIFRHMDVLDHVHFGNVHSNTNTSAQTFWHGCPCAKLSFFWNILVSKCSNAKTYPCQNVHGFEKYRAQMYLCWNFLITKSPRYEMFMPKCLLPKCQDLKWAQADETTLSSLKRKYVWGIYSENFKDLWLIFLKYLKNCSRKSQIILA